MQTSDITTVPEQELATLLAQQEAVIERGLKSFIEVGEALAAIRDQRLYRATHHTFDAYLEDRWPDLGKRNYAHKLIKASRIATELGTAVPNATPSSEWQIRPLVALPTRADRLVAWEGDWERAASEGRSGPTAADVERAVPDLEYPSSPADDPPARAPVICAMCGKDFTDIYWRPPAHCSVCQSHHAADEPCPYCEDKARRERARRERQERLANDPAAAAAVRLASEHILPTLAETAERLRALVDELERQRFRGHWWLVDEADQCAMTDALCAIGRSSETLGFLLSDWADENAAEQASGGNGADADDEDDDGAA
jgi:hypothetical protein